MAALDQIIIDLSAVESGLELVIDARTANTLFDCEDAVLHAEARYQLKEGCFYDYEFSSDAYTFQASDYIQPHVRKKHTGRIAPNIYVGTLSLEICKTGTVQCIHRLSLEVCSVKSDYRSDYRYMLESITERCAELIMQIDSPVTQHIQPDFETGSKTLYQRFSFVKSLIDSREFEEAVQKIITSPTTKWETESHKRDIRNMRKFGRNDIQQLVSRSNRMSFPKEHVLHQQYGISSVPMSIESVRKTESTDTSENRFVKHALQDFLFFCERCRSIFAQDSRYLRSEKEAKGLSDKLSNLLNQSFFKDISRPESLKLNSPVLQRKSGYREVLNAWMKYDLAAKLIWEGGENVYDAGKKDIASLYEYWLFFALLDLLKEVFSIEPKEIHRLIKFDKHRLSLNLKQGTAIAMKGIYNSPSRKLNIQFSYNRSFGGGRTYPHGGSYTTTLRPDYTLSIWPAEITDQKFAEKTEQITHIHFDAKYKVSNFYELITTSKNDELSAVENIQLMEEEEAESKTGTFKNQDLLKMHAYKDAIRRTGGAYVLYPGEGSNDPFRGFHELIPGLGAFVIKPNKSEKEKDALKEFIQKVVQNFIDRASQREHTASKVYDIHKTPKADKDILNSPMPEYIDGEKLIPNETYVLVGYSRSKERTAWYAKHNLYNFRMDDNAGSLILDSSVVNAKYLLLRQKGEESASDIYRIVSKGPKVYSKSQLEKIGYPTDGNLKEYYLVVEIEKIDHTDFGNVNWHFKELEAYKNIKTKNKNVYEAAGMPFVVSLVELMGVVERV
jgi:predicted component of viral defense system (DUF524 family)